MGLKTRSQKIKQKLKKKNWSKDNMPFTLKNLVLLFINVHCLVSGVNILIRGGQIRVSGIVILGVSLALSSMNIRCRLRSCGVAVGMQGNVSKIDF